MRSFASRFQSSVHRLRSIAIYGAEEVQGRSASGDRELEPELLGAAQHRSRYRSRKAAKEAVVIERMKELSAQYGGDDYLTYAGPDEQTLSDSSPTAEPT